MARKISSLTSSARLRPEISAPRLGVSGRTAKGKRRSTVAFMARQLRSWADITGSRGTLEAADRFGEQLFRQPQHHVRQEHAEGDRQQEHDVERQRANKRSAKADADV